MPQIKRRYPRRIPFVGARTTDTTPIPTQIGNYDYEIPANYFDTQPDSTCNWEGKLFVALLPDFEGRSEASSRELDTAVGQDARRVTMLLSTDRARKASAQKMLDIWANVVEEGNTPFEKAQYPFYNLEYLYHTGKRQRFLATDQFRYYKDKKLMSHLECKLIGSVPSPGCTHSFAVNDVRVQMHYPRSRLKEWQQIEATARKLIQGWTKGRIGTRKPLCDEFL